MSRSQAFALSFAVVFTSSVMGATAMAADRPVPTASLHPVLAADQVAAFRPQPLDLGRIGREDALREAQDLPERFAIPAAVSMTPADSGTWEDLGGGQRLWRLRILAPKGTNSINLGFTRFRLSEGDRLLVYSTDRKLLLRPFTVADNEAHGELWTPVVPTADLMIELTLARADSTAELKLGWVNQGYRGFGTISDASYDKSGSCNLDVQCLDSGDSWRTVMQAVAVISTGGSTFCTGSLINNTANDHKMYFMTANHCGINSGNAASLVAFWNYQNSFCRTPGSGASGAAGDGTLTQFHTGAFFRAANSPSDFTLVELDDPPVGAFNHYWAGWNRSTADFTCTAGVPCSAIHHPQTDEKRITYVTTNTATTSYNGSSSPGDGSHVWAHWATDPPGPFTVPGVTEPGSSGSPLYDSAGLFIGQLHGGPSACGATGDNLSDYYGRFSVSWTGGGTDSTRLSNWLDAGSTGVITLTGIAACTAPGAPAIGTATASGPNQIQITFANGAPPSTTYNLYRAVGTCAAPGSFVAIATGLAGSPHDDSGVSGGTTYAYRVTGVDSTGGCESTPSACVQATATGSCTLPPTFAGLTSATNDEAATCGVGLSWSAGTANCGGPLSYSVYRSTTSGFAPAPANRIATGVAGAAYADAGPLNSGTTYYYVVRAVDAANSIEDGNTTEQGTAPTGPIATGSMVETFEGVGGFDNPGWTHTALSGATDWVLSGAQVQTPSNSWFSDSQTAVSARVLVSPNFVPLASSTLSFWHTFAFETNGAGTACYDAGTLEISTNGGASWSVVPDAAFTAGGFNGTVNNSFANPLGGKRAWCQGSVATMTQVTANLGSFVGATEAKLRWQEGDDSSAEATGWFVDSVTLANVGTASSCQSGTAAAGTQYFSVSPCRLFDTRNAPGPLGGPAIGATATRTLTASGNCGLPVGATAVALNVTVVNTTAAGFLQAYAADQSPAATSVVNFAAGATRANNAVVGVDAAGAMKLTNGSAAPLDVVLDVVGYFGPGNDG